MSSIDKEQLRIKALSESKSFNNKQRFGYFSMTSSTAIGDDGPYKTKIHPRNQMGKPETSPRNFQTSPLKTGQLSKSFFGKLNSLAEKKDEYIQISKRLQHEQKQQRKKINKQKQFFPQNNYKILMSSSYEYKQQMNPQKNPKRYRLSDGKVKSVERNFQTNPQSNVISAYFKPIKNMSDPYERLHDMEWQRQKNQKSKQGEVPFSPNKFKNDCFNSSKSIYEDFEIKKQHSFHETQFNIRKHERRWRVNNANRSGIYGYFQPFPPYIENPPVELTKSQRQSDKQVFKAMNATTLGIPSPSVLSHPSNLRKLINNSFSHKP